MLVATERILVVAGNNEEARTLGSVLERNGYRTCYASRQPALIEALTTVEPDFILIGAGIQDVSANEVIQAILSRSTTEYAPAIGVIRRGEVPPSELVDADVFFIPPNLTDDELLDTVRAVLHGRRQVREYQQELENLRRSHLELKQRYSRALLRNRYLSTDLTRIEREIASLQEKNIAPTLESRRQAISELAGAISHELNQPLTVILGRLQLLRRTGSEPDTETMRVIEEQSKRMADIVQKIGHIHDYATKPYADGQRIIDLDRASR